MSLSILKKFQIKLPQIVELAQNSSIEEEFFSQIKELLIKVVEENNTTCSFSSAKSLLEMLEYESQSIKELSRGEKIYIETFSMLWNFLRGENISNYSPDLFEDLYQLFSRALGVIKDPNYSLNKFTRDIKRWPSGLDKEIRGYRISRKESIISLLISKIEKRGATSSRYKFPEGISTEEKREMVREWWQDFRFHLAMAIRTPSELNLYLEESLSTKMMKRLIKARNKKIPFFITPYYLSLLNSSQSGFNDWSIRSYILYSDSLVEAYGNIKAWEKEDRVVNGEPNAAGWILPDGANIHRRYPEVAIMIPDTRGRSCGGLCASCQRMYDFQSERLNFDLEALKPKESWDKKLTKLMEYFENDSQIRDILITGGDAFMSRNKVLEKILDQVLKMAKRKREANEKRADGQKYHELQRVRLGSRLLAYLPMRIDKDLIDILKRFKEQGTKLGISQFVVQTHFQSPLEVTVEAKRAIEMILSAGWLISNQLVFNAASSRRGHTAKLRQVLNSLGVVTYYTFTVKGFEENMEVFAPNSRSMQEKVEEKNFFKLSPLQQEELNSIFIKGEKIAENLTKFLRRGSLLFIPTDRNVLNLPAIGKSMTFKTVGINKDGKRILKFEHDSTREHSPIINQLGAVFIIENRSILSYLKELEHMGESKREYSSIWSYTSGETEKLSTLFDYPHQNFTPTKVMTNLKID